MSQAIVFRDVDQVELADYTPPAVGPGELLVKTLYTGVSQGTEIWALTGRRPELKFPTIPGYQGVGIVEEVGPDVSGFEVGQRVVFHHARVAEAWPETWMGTHTGHAVVPLGNNPPPRVIPEGVDSVTAAIAAMAAVSLRGLEMLRIGYGDLVVVNGQGLIGQAAAQLARLRGATVVTSDLSPRRVDLSRAHSADVAVDISKASLADTVRELRPLGADVVIETTGRSDQFAPCVDLLRWEGQLLLQGYYPQPVTFDFHATHLKKPTIAVTCGIGDTACILELLERNKLQWREMVTDLVPVSESPRLYERMRQGDPNVLGVVFDWSTI